MRMNKKELFDALDEFSQNLLVTLAEVEAIKKNLKSVVEENVALRLENDKLRERLGQVEHAATPKTKRNRDNLRKLYEDGFHVCTDFYGQRRENDAECMFCDELLFRELAGRFKKVLRVSLLMGCSIWWQLRLGIWTI